MSLHWGVPQNILVISNAVCVGDMNTNKWVQVVHEQVKQVYDINEALAKGINSLDIEIVVQQFLHFSSRSEHQSQPLSGFCQVRSEH
jgi:hypothetical protein